MAPQPPSDREGSGHWSRRRLLGLAGAGLGLGALASPVAAALARGRSDTDVDGMALPFDPMAGLRRFNHGSVNRENGVPIRVFEVRARSLTVPLMQQGTLSQAEKHIGHPVEELYGSVEPELERRGVKPFKGELMALLELIQASPGSPATQQAYRVAVAAVDGARLGVPDSVSRDPSITAAVVREIVRVAASEYDASMADGAIVETIEYQDSRGFVLFAEQLLKASLAPGSGAETIALLTPIQQRLAGLAKAWPSLEPPVRPVLPARMVTILSSQL